MSLLCSCAVVSGADGWQIIADFGRAKLGWLRQFLPFAYGIPSADGPGWVTARLPARQFKAGFVEWTRSVAHLSDGEVVAVDGMALP